MEDLVDKDGAVLADLEAVGDKGGAHSSPRKEKKKNTNANERCRQ